MPDSQILEMTGVQNFINPDNTLAVGHKLGGDNMSLLEENMKVAEILGEKGVSQSYCVSAFRSSRLEFNTTSKLISAGESQNQNNILNTLSEISDFHSKLLEEILLSLDTKIKSQLITYAKNLFEEYKTQLSDNDFTSCTQSTDYMIGVGEKAYSLLSVGEVIAAKVFTKYLQLNNIPAIYVDIASLRGINPSSLSQEVGEFLRGEFDTIHNRNSLAIPIIPGYIGGIQGGILQALGRGYTDYTGERSAVSMYESGKYEKVLFYIQKMYGFKSTDPRELENPESARSLDTLSFSLAHRAIALDGANAGLINPHALSPSIIRNKISILVGNPTDNSDIAHINEEGNPESVGVELVLGRFYNSKYDDRTYNRGLRRSDNHHIVYLMGDNLQQLGEIYSRATSSLKKAGISDIAGESKLTKPKEMSFVFKNEQDAKRAQRVLHREFIES